MIKQCGSRISLVTLILCLCLGSLVILPLLNVVGLSLPEISGVDLRETNLLDHFEFDEGFIVESILGTTIAEKFISQSRPMNLDFRTASLSPVSPPPKHS
jgi:hypothetical protein